ncbi:hypothetical protein M407DRAFT_21876 [Tulasnella calospora MUT 4182]|uniref:Uncharacterized protein n=1 Tax=Tulasnella calospora MUT 4182 TaxID=1051891 RepID=A0A0C3QDE2_9AGAM|nr:hypothetical protein M407DRAFT_21876 [Tulasnella calospora MUT 4182]
MPPRSCQETLSEEADDSDEISHSPPYRHASTLLATRRRNLDEPFVEGSADSNTFVGNGPTAALSSTQAQGHLATSRNAVSTEPLAPTWLRSTILAVKAPSQPARRPLPAIPVTPVSYQRRLRGTAIASCQEPALEESPTLGHHAQRSFDPGAAAANSSGHHWQLGYHTEQQCAACKRPAVAPLVLVCQCSSTHAFCAHHLDLFGRKASFPIQNDQEEGQGSAAEGTQYNSDLGETHLREPSVIADSDSQSRSSLQRERSPSSISYAASVDPNDYSNYGPPGYKRRFYRSVGIQADKWQNINNDSANIEAMEALFGTVYQPSTAPFPALQVMPSDFQSSDEPLTVQGSPLPPASPQPPGGLPLSPPRPLPSVRTSELSELSSFPSAQPSDAYSDYFSNTAVHGSDYQLQGSSEGVGNEEEPAAGAESEAELEAKSEVETDGEEDHYSDVSMASA